MIGIGGTKVKVESKCGAVEIRNSNNDKLLERLECQKYSTKIISCKKCSGNEFYGFVNMDNEELKYIQCDKCKKEVEIKDKYVDFDGTEIMEEQRNFLLDKLVCPECKKSNEFIIIPKCGEVEYKCKECGESIVVNCEDYETLKEKCECGNEVFVLEVEREGNIDLYDSYCKKCHERSEDSYVYFDGSKIVKITEDKRSILLLEDKIKKKNRLIHRLEVKLSKKNRLIKKLRNKLNNPDGAGGAGGSRGEEDWGREKEITFDSFRNYEREREKEWDREIGW